MKIVITIRNAKTATTLISTIQIGSEPNWSIEIGGTGSAMITAPPRH
ncbi:hypothetical protein [Fodinicola feengrottensis]|nr:hypothetical protein [Fodinicola feengrottensis]